MYERKKFGKIFTSKFVGTGPSTYKKKNLPGRGLTKFEKHCCGPHGTCYGTALPFYISDIALCFEILVLKFFYYVCKRGLSFLNSRPLQNQLTVAFVKFSKSPEVNAFPDVCFKLSRTEPQNFALKWFKN